VVEDPTLYSTVEGSNPVAGMGREKRWKQFLINSSGKETGPYNIFSNYANIFRKLECFRAQEKNDYDNKTV